MNRRNEGDNLSTLLDHQKCGRAGLATMPGGMLGGPAFFNPLPPNHGSMGRHPVRRFLLHRLPWGEQVSRNVCPEPRPEDGLSLRAEIDPTLPTVMPGFVFLGSVGPNPAGRVQVTRPNEANLMRPHSREALELDHGPNLAGDVGPDGVHERLRDRLDRLRLPNIGPAPAEAGDGLEAVMDGGRDHPYPDGPPKQPHEPARSLVHFVPTETGIDHRLANGFELEGPEIAGHRVAVESAEWPDRPADRSRFRRRPPVLDIVRVGESEIGQEQFVDGEIGADARGLSFLKSCTYGK